MKSTRFALAVLLVMLATGTVLAANAMLLAGGLMLAAAQDVLSSDGSNTGQWNPGGPEICQKHVTEYNALTSACPHPANSPGLRGASSQVRNSASPGCGT
jgi:hypothetical protein